MGTRADPYIDETCERLSFPRNGGIETCSNPTAYRTPMGGMCSKHVSWLFPPFMPRWWYIASAALVALFVSGALIVSVVALVK